jgi:hypothetical protein
MRQLGLGILLKCIEDNVYQGDWEDLSSIQWVQKSLGTEEIKATTSFASKINTKE